MRYRIRLDRALVERVADRRLSVDFSPRTPFAPTRAIEQRGATFDTAPLPVPAQILVYTSDEWTSMVSREDRFGRVLRDETVWVYERE